MADHYTLFTAEDRDRFLSPREGETKVGEEMVYLPHWGAVREHPQVKYVLLGVPESVGPQANHGRPGSERGWEAFLGKFLNMQSNRYLPARQVAVAGAVHTADLQQQVDPADTRPERFAEWRELVTQLDARVAQAVADLDLPPDVTLIVIGGGHNNVYPILKGLGQPTWVVNVDPHADFRALEGRHSGNGFRYAREEGLLEGYVPVALHKAYNSENMIAAMQADRSVHPQWWDDAPDVPTMLEHAHRVLAAGGARQVGLEMDVDVIAQMPVSAYTPEGLTPGQARAWMREWVKVVPATRYVHLPEAAPQSPREMDFAGKLLAYLVSDFIMSSQLVRQKNR